MSNIQVLDQHTINKIAAGEVIERPASVVKELLENAIDAKATAITVEIRDGGISFIRVTDNGFGIPKEELPLAFLRHATSKIQSVEDLFVVSSLGFRGEALSSIAAVSQVEIITKTPNTLTGIRYQIEGGVEKEMEEIGAPEGTTFISRNLFYNTPVRRTFLKTAATEGSHVADFVEKIALSHPEVSIRFIQNNQNKLHTSGNHNLKDIIYTVFGREIAANLISIERKSQNVSITGLIGKPMVARSNRNFEYYFINGRYIKSNMISKAIEEAYKPFMMQHKYPFTMLHITIDSRFLDINVHPTKMELRFQDGEQVFGFIKEVISEALLQKELIPEILLKDKKLEQPESLPISKTIKEKRIPLPEPFEKKRMDYLHISPEPAIIQVEETTTPYVTKPQEKPQETKTEEQLDLFGEKLLEPKARSRHKLIGQLFDTYWLVEFQEQLYIIDQHAAHEKVLYEKTMASLKTRTYTSQMVNPPIILTLGSKEMVMLTKYLPYFQKIGFEIEPFGGREYAVRGIPGNLFTIAKKELLLEMLDHLSEETQVSNTDMVFEKIASMSCKSAVKGNQTMTALEADHLIDQLLDLENPYACPHGRPTIISMSRYELEKKFKRIV